MQQLLPVLQSAASAVDDQCEQEERRLGLQRSWCAAGARPRHRLRLSLPHLRLQRRRLQLGQGKEISAATARGSAPLRDTLSTQVVLSKMGAKLVHCGSVGNCQVAKLCNNNFTSPRIQALRNAMGPLHLESR
jgi:hypothetical protein